MNETGARLLFLTKHSRCGASSRYRTYQYLPYLEKAGFTCISSPLFDEAYLEHRYRTGGRAYSAVLQAFVRRVKALLSASSYDLVIIEKEILPYFPALPEFWLRWLGVPYVVDYDDALFHQYDQHRSRWIRLAFGSKIPQVMRNAQLVTAGNAYLGDFATKAGAARVAIFPTVIDLDRYPLGRARSKESPQPTIGWIGSPSTAKYLLEIAPSLKEVCTQEDARLHLVGSGPLELPGVPHTELPWSESTEVDFLKQFDIGIMPLPDEPWARGKCGFKLIQYMACGLPVVASPVGVNTEIVEHGVNGYLASSTEEWSRALQALSRDPELRHRMGAKGRQKVESSFSLQVMAPRLISSLASITVPFQRNTSTGKRC